MLLDTCMHILNYITLSHMAAHMCITSSFVLIWVIGEAFHIDEYFQYECCVNGADLIAQMQDKETTVTSIWFKGYYGLVFKTQVEQVLLYMYYWWYKNFVTLQWCSFCICPQGMLLAVSVKIYSLQYRGCHGLPCYWTKWTLASTVTASSTSSMNSVMSIKLSSQRGMLKLSLRSGELTRMNRCIGMLHIFYIYMPRHLLSIRKLTHMTV